MNKMQESRSGTSSRCCESGHPIAIDPVTGSTVCSCKIHSGVPAYLSRVPRLPESYYGPISASHGNSDSMASFYPSYPADRLIDTRPAVPGITPTPSYLAHTMAAHPYSPYYPDFDLMGARRKNATRETTGPLKSWLYQHRKNPYPTKAEKVMLAIITQMTLTQVSTWFANARRRLKKENKLGKDVDISDIDVEDKNGNDISLNISTDSSNSETSFAENRNRLSSVVSDISDTDDRASPNAVSKKCVHRLFSPDSRDELFMERMSSPESIKRSETNDACKDSEIKGAENREMAKSQGNSDNRMLPSTRQTKPKIWSVADMLR